MDKNSYFLITAFIDEQMDTLLIEFCKPYISIHNDTDFFESGIFH